MLDATQHYLFRTSYGHWNVMRGRQLLAGRRDLFEALDLLWYFARLQRGHMHERGGIAP
ncbi:hypothetical protein [Stenotrophomonas sp. HMWF003]|uniref:hypothetical protein n=1 Tax=Stenotrophomonas sp. HMWF003 TaxID=2056840 RepID=UPI0015E85D8A|nr:hypothetical protein [Stenotrophomonas sp. HMWF003]